MSHNLGQAGANRLEVAGALYDALKHYEPAALVQSDPRKGAQTLIDGAVDLVELANAVLKVMNRPQTQ